MAFDPKDYEDEEPSDEELDEISDELDVEELLSEDFDDISEESDDPWSDYDGFDFQNYGKRGRRI